MGCTNLARNLGNPSLYLDCLQFMLAPFPIGGDPLSDGEPSMAADILNNSWGCPTIEGCDPNTLLNAARSLETDDFGLTSERIGALAADGPPPPRRPDVLTSGQPSRR